MWEYGPTKKFAYNLVQKQEVRETYDGVIKDQLENNIMEEVTDADINNISIEFYLPHRSVICESVE